MNKDSELTYEEKLKEELELVRCDLHNAYSWLKAQEEENKQLKDNWSVLREYICKEYYMFLPLDATTKSIMILLDKMQELESGDNNE